MATSELEGFPVRSLVRRAIRHLHAGQRWPYNFGNTCRLALLWQGKMLLMFFVAIRWMHGSATSELDRLLDVIVGRTRCSASSRWAAVAQDPWRRTPLGIFIAARAVADLLHDLILDMLFGYL